MKRSFCVFILLQVLAVMCAYAAGDGVGAVAGNMLEPIALLRQLMSAASLIVGVYLLAAAFTRYLRFRDNPQESPISTVITWAILGLALVILPLMHQLAVEAAVNTGAADVAI